MLYYILYRKKIPKVIKEKVRIFPFVSLSEFFYTGLIEVPQGFLISEKDLAEYNLISILSKRNKIKSFSGPFLESEISKIESLMQFNRTPKMSKRLTNIVDLVENVRNVESRSIDMYPAFSFLQQIKQISNVLIDEIKFKDKIWINSYLRPAIQSFIECRRNSELVREKHVNENDEITYSFSFMKKYGLEKKLKRNSNLEIYQSPLS